MLSARDYDEAMSKAAVLLTAVSTALITAACAPQVSVCPDIAAAPVVSVTVDREYVPNVRSLHLRACQDGTCAEGPLDLQPGTVTVGEECNHAAGPNAVCSATASPDGTLRGTLVLGPLTESPVEITVTGVGSNGAPLPVRNHTIIPVVSIPYGEQCGRFISASATLGKDGLSSGLAKP